MMKRIKLVTYSILIVLLVFVNYTLFGQDNKVINVNKDIVLIPVCEDIFMHTSYFDFPGYGRAPSNGLVLIKNGNALLIDTPNTNEQTEQLVSYLKDSLNAIVSKVIVGHYHSDCMGGLKFLHEQTVESYSGSLTRTECINKNLPVPQKYFDDSLSFDFYGEKVICNYFGAGHTPDNIVVYLPNKKTLFGGCLVKSKHSENLGSIKEADIDNWDKTIENIISAYPDIEYIIPGHGSFGNFSLLTHTIDLVKQYRAMEPK